MFQHFLSILSWLTLANAFSYRQKIHFPCICFGKRMESVSCSKHLKLLMRRQPGASGSSHAQCSQSVYSTDKDLLFFSSCELWDFLCFSLTDSWLISFIIKN